MNVKRLSFDEFCRSEEAWDELVLASDAAVPFLCHAWLRLWWQHFGADQEFVAIIVRDDARLLAAVPLALRRARLWTGSLLIGEIVGTGPVPTRGMGLADKADLIARQDAPGARERLAVEMMDLLGQVDVFDIKGFDALSPSAQTLEACAPQPQAVRSLIRSLSPYLDLSEGWESYLRSRSRNFRKHLKKYRRLLEEAGPMQIDRLDPGGDHAGWISEIFAVNGESWKAERGTDLFRSPEIRAFFSDLVPVMSAKGRIDLWRIRLAERPAVYELCFDFGGRLFSYNGAYRRELQHASPGTALTATVIESACERGRSEYDMLRGDEEYKLRWSETTRAEMQSTVPASHPFSRSAAYLGIHLKARLKQWKRVERLGDAVSGWLNRKRYRS